MPTTLTGSSAGIADGDAASVNGPADGDPYVAASVNTPLQYLLNRAKYLTDFVSKTHTWSALQTFAQGAVIASSGALVAKLRSTTASAGKQLVSEHEGNGTGRIRTYVAPGGSEKTWNAYWDGTDWRADTNAFATVLSMTAGKVEVWTSQTLVAAGAVLDFGTVPLQLNGGESPVANTLQKFGIPKAWGAVHVAFSAIVAGTSQTYNAGLSMGMSGSSVTVDVTFAVPMADAKYAVSISTRDPTRQVWVVEKLAGLFKVASYGFGSGDYDWSGGDLGFDFTVMGRQ